MKIAFLATAQRDLDWFRHYYQSVFPEGGAGARVQYRLAVAALRDNPRIGRPDEHQTHRVLVIPRTPFSFVYRITDARIEVVRVLDGRSDRR